MPSSLHCLYKEESLAAVERGEPELPITVLPVVMATKADTLRRWSECGPD